MRMRCPTCNVFGACDVVDSRPIEQGRGQYRRRECTACHARFNTMELPNAGEQPPPLLDTPETLSAEIARLSLKLRAMLRNTTKENR